MEVRTIKPEELDLTLDIVEEYFDGLEDYDPDSAVETVKTYTAQYHYHWLSAFDGPNPIGFIGGYITPAPWNEDRLTGHVAMIYLIESNATTENYETLIDYFVNWVSSVGGQRIVFSSVEPELQHNFDRFDATERRID